MLPLSCKLRSAANEVVAGSGTDAVFEREREGSKPWSFLFPDSVRLGDAFFQIRNASCFGAFRQKWEIYSFFAGSPSLRFEEGHRDCNSDHSTWRCWTPAIRLLAIPRSYGFGVQSASAGASPLLSVVRQSDLQRNGRLHLQVPLPLGLLRVHMRLQATLLVRNPWRLANVGPRRTQTSRKRQWSLETRVHPVVGLHSHRRIGS